MCASEDYFCDVSPKLALVSSVAFSLGWRWRAMVTALVLAVVAIISFRPAATKV
jgi:hypothetical protein